MRLAAKGLSLRLLALFLVSQLLKVVLQINHKLAELLDRGFIVSVGFLGRAETFELFSQKHITMIYLGLQLLLGFHVIIFQFVRELLEGFEIFHSRT